MEWQKSHSTASLKGVFTVPRRMIFHGEVSERFKDPVLKTGRR